MDTIFDHFEETPYTFLKIKRGTVEGNLIEDVFNTTGVFKKRSGEVTINNEESRQSESTLHIHPEESFLEQLIVDGKLLIVGHGIRYQGVDYEIVNVTDGFNYEDNVLEHYRLTLQEAEFVEETS